MTPIAPLSWVRTGPKRDGGLNGNPGFRVTDVSCDCKGTRTHMCTPWGPWGGPASVSCDVTAVEDGRRGEGKRSPRAEEGIASSSSHQHARIGCDQELSGVLSCVKSIATRY
jgi:hypothetical protein